MVYTEDHQLIPPLLCSIEILMVVHGPKYSVSLDADIGYQLDCLVLDVQPTTYFPELVMICFDLAEYTT